jgi:peptidoglycan/xylan/chitin deacetylase (PgdA/CDA1 family)/predicted O-methyltransferase YrrM
MRIPILTYQPMNIHGNAYHANHLKALEADLLQLTEAGFRVVPLSTAVDAWLEGRAGELEGRIVALASDDGADFDYRDLPHPVAGMQRSAINVLRDFAARHPGRQPGLHITAFTVVSPEARAALDKACMLGRGWWSEDWWREAVGSGLMHVASHSWDHNHEALPPSFSLGVARGTFGAIASRRLADHEIRQAAQYLRSHVANPGAALFAYPYGEGNAYLVEDYLPAHAVEIGLKAAFTARPGFWEDDTGRWEIPRFVCGRDWRSPEELRTILDDASGSGRAWTARRPGDATASGGFVAFLRSRVEAIPGWMHAEAALLTAHLTELQRSLGISGPVLEIGVFRGKYLSVLYELSTPDERVVGVDLFVGASDKDAAAARARADIAAACGDDSRLAILVADSLELDAAKLARLSGEGAFRFVSIDGGHTRELVHRDLETASPLLQPGGIMALDDVFNFGTPGVLEGVAEFFLRAKPALAPFAICYNKVFVTTPDFHARYLAGARRFLDEYPWLPTSRNTLARCRENAQAGFTPMLFGYEVLPFL